MEVLCSPVIPPVHSARLDWTAENTRESRPEKSAVRRWKWWQWPHLLSLDAPVVAVTWLWWWASQRNVHLPANRFVILAFAVWSVYVADRLADVAGTERSGPQTDRHLFSATHGPWLLGAIGVVLPTLAALTAFNLPPGRFLGGLGLLGLVAFYYWAIHHAPRSTRPWLPKEAVVGGMFALGTVFFLFGEGKPGDDRLWLEAGMFGGLCFLNCALISAWERCPQDLEDPASLLRAFPGVAANLGNAALILAVISAVAALATRTAGPLPTAMSAGALWILHRRRASTSAESLRVLADLVLLTPWLVAIMD